ncbi:MAG: hypothetical protein ACAI38_12600 [Myxococcota bacterium]
MKLEYALAAALVMPLACNVSDPDGPDFADDPGPGDVTEPRREPVVVQRERRRLDIDQLDAAIKRVTGGLYWVRVGDTTKTNQLVALAASLGKPDYVEITEEDLAPTSLFLKFLNDASRAVCAELIKAEATRPERVFVAPASFTDQPGSPVVDATLRRAILRFHGQKPDDASLSPWGTLFATVVARDAAVNAAGSAEDHVKAGWNAVCVALITHPDFYTY